MAHKWQEIDDIKVLYIVKYGYQFLSYDKNSVSKQIGVTNGSLSYRIGNFKAIEKIGKATHYSKLSKSVYDKYNLLSESELKALAFNII